MKNILLLFIFSSSVFANLKVINGINLMRQEFPSVFRTSAGCTATFISKRVFITSSHCVFSSVETIGNTSARYIMHPRYNLSFFHNRQFNKFYDVALGILPYNVESPLNSEPIPFCNKSSDNFLGEKVVLVGYGCNTWPQAQGGRVKRYGFSYIDSIEGILVTSSVTGEAGGLSCPGDSGAPYLLVRNDNSVCYLSTNFFSNRVSKNYSITHIDPAIRDWIKRVLDINSARVCGLNKQCPEVFLPSSMIEE